MPNGERNVSTKHEAASTSLESSKLPFAWLKILFRLMIPTSRSSQMHLRRSLKDDQMTLHMVLHFGAKMEDCLEVLILTTKMAAKNASVSILPKQVWRILKHQCNFCTGGSYQTHRDMGLFELILCPILSMKSNSVCI